ncbi:MAG: carbohydrate kinase [Opitutales bacterium]|jgi:fructokinase|nr:carbohydrate kinase [Opitutales bacterium]
MTTLIFNDSGHPKMSLNKLSDKKYAVCGIGELLWDVFPSHKRVGGAPANFAYHAQQLGAKSWPVSCIGADPLGEELREHLKEVGVDDCYVKESVTYLTGTVDVVLRSGKPSYDIHENVAWDHIPFTEDLQRLAGKLDAVCFGSLSQRWQESRQSIHSFLDAMPAHALKIFDVNLRQSFYSKLLIRRSLELANVLKLSDEELPVMLDMFDLEGGPDDQLRQLLELFDLRLVAYTRGAQGSLLVGVDAMHDFPGRESEVVDTVGAGDSFTAALCMGLLHGWPLSEVNLFANKVADYVCSQLGATPKLPTELT